METDRNTVPSAEQQDLPLLLWLLSNSDSLCCLLQGKGVPMVWLDDTLQKPEDLLSKTKVYWLEAFTRDRDIPGADQFL